MIKDKPGAMETAYCFAGIAPCPRCGAVPALDNRLYPGRYMGEFRLLCSCGNASKLHAYEAYHKSVAEYMTMIKEAEQELSPAGS